MSHIMPGRQRAVSDLDARLSNLPGGRRVPFSGPATPRGTAPPLQRTSISKVYSTGMPLDATASIGSLDESPGSPGEAMNSLEEFRSQFAARRAQSFDGPRPPYRRVGSTGKLWASRIGLPGPMDDATSAESHGSGASAGPSLPPRASDSLSMQPDADGSSSSMMTRRRCSMPGRISDSMVLELTVPVNSIHIYLLAAGRLRSPCPIDPLCCLLPVFPVFCSDGKTIRSPACPPISVGVNRPTKSTCVFLVLSTSGGLQPFAPLLQAVAPFARAHHPYHQTQRQLVGRSQRQRVCLAQCQRVLRAQQQRDIVRAPQRQLVGRSQRQRDWP